MTEHHHHHHHEDSQPMPFQDKVVKLLEHWIKHNEDHGQTYREWAARAGENQLEEVKALLEEVAEATAGITRKLKAAADRLPRDEK